MSNKVVASSMLDKAQITACEFKSETEFATCGVKHVKFWTVNGYNLTSERGIVDPFKPLVSATFAFPKKNFVTGTIDGILNIWEKNKVLQWIPAHQGPIFVLLAKNNILLSGGKDGKLISWNSDFQQISCVNITGSYSKNPSIRAVDINNAGAILIGTNEAEILKIYHDAQTTLVHGHFFGELWGLCVAPNGTKFATCGGDKTVRLWSLEKMINCSQEFPEEARACDWSSNSNFIALATLNGLIITVNPTDKLNEIKKLQSTFHKGQWIEDIKISPSNQLIAFGAHMGVSPVEVMKVNEQGSELLKFKIINIGFTSSLCHLDWDVSSSALIANSVNELVFVNVPSGSVMKATSCGNIDWHTWSCALGYSVKGLLPEFSSSVVVTSICRSHSRKLVAAGDNLSRVKLYKYPCLVPNAPYKAYIGHSSPVPKVKFLNEDKFLVSIGCRDKAVIIWQSDVATNEGEHEKEEEFRVGSEEIYNEIELPPKEEFEKKKETPEEEKEHKFFDLLTIQEIIEGIKEPSGFIKPQVNQDHAPKIGVKLNYVHGYRSRDCKNNIRYLNDGSIAYHAATLGIVLDKDTNTQRFFNQHTSAILAIAFHPDGIRLATGDLSPKPEIYIWNSTTCSQLAKFSGHLENGIRSLAYSPSGDRLAAVDMNDYHMLAIYDTSNAILVALSKIDLTLVLQVVFKTEDQLVTVGPNHFMFWQSNNKSLTSKKGNFKDKNPILGCVSAEKELILTGNAAGDLCRWEDNICVFSKAINANKPLDCITIAQQM